MGRMNVKKYRNICIIGAMLLLAVSGCSKKEEKVEPEDRVFMVNDTLYYGTEETGPMGDVGCVEGEILSTTKAGELPTENGQSNFGGIGNPYTFDSGDGAIMVFVEEEYFWFYAKETAKTEGTFTGGYDDSDMGDTGEGYPMGSTIIVSFRGNLETLSK